MVFRCMDRMRPAWCCCGQKLWLLFNFLLACVAWRFWLGAQSNKGGRGQKTARSLGRKHRALCAFLRSRTLGSAYHGSNHQTTVVSLQDFDCVRGTRTQPLISVRCSVQLISEIFWDCICVETHLSRYEALAYVLPHFDALTHVVIRVSLGVHLSNAFAEVRGLFCLQ